jgi:hypothetical protein
MELTRPGVRLSLISYSTMSQMLLKVQGVAVMQFHLGWRTCALK